MAQLRAHAVSCAVCQAELDGARELLVRLDTLPDFAPSVSFADRVMSDVQVFEPWHAAATRTVTGWVPAARPARMAAGLAAALFAGLGTAGATWAVARADMGVLLAQVGLERFREQTVAAGNDLVATVLGQPGLEALRGSTPEMVAMALGAFVAVAGMGVVGIRVLATSPRTR